MIEATTNGLLCLFLAWASASDLRSRRIPNPCTLAGSLVLAAVAVATGSDWAPRLAVGVVAFGVLAGLSLLRPGSLGMGDAKLAGMISIATGPIAPLALSLGFLLALLATVPMLVRRGRPEPGKITLAIGPYLSLGAVLAIALVG